ncbi:hypothetical protein LV779_38325 [Streptomyces thinghirensis]|nr:hypothetical protein [Streptomyces thinghirensis]
MLDLAIFRPPSDPDDVEGWVDHLAGLPRRPPRAAPALLFWEGMGTAPPAAPRGRTPGTTTPRKVAAVRDGQARGVVTDAIPAPDLLFLLVAMTNWASVVPQIKRILVGGEDTDADRLRASIKEAARRIVSGQVR